MKKAELHRSFEEDARDSVRELEEMARSPRYAFLQEMREGTATVEDDNGRLFCIESPWRVRQSADQHASLKRLYTYAAWHPWSGLPAEVSAGDD